MASEFEPGKQVGKIPVRELLNSAFPGIDNALNRKALELGVEGLHQVDKYTGRPIRAGLSAALDGENPLRAGLESIVNDKDVDGQEVAHKLLEKMEQGTTLRAPGQKEFPSEVPVGHAISLAADPTPAALHFGLPLLSKALRAGKAVAPVAEEAAQVSKELPVVKLPTSPEEYVNEQVHVSDQYKDLTGKGLEYKLNDEGEPIAVFVDGKIPQAPTPSSDPTLAPEAVVKDLLNLPRKQDLGNEAVRASAKEYALEKGMDPSAHEMLEVDPERGRRIAGAFDEMKHDPNDPKVKAAYEALHRETLDQYNQMMAQGLKLSKIPPGAPNPYAEGSKALLSDIRDNQHMHYFPTEQGFGAEGAQVADHPLMQKAPVQINGEDVPMNDVFRIVHDYYGHAKEGVGFGPKGEENAYQIHRKMFSPDAQKALATETRGQNSWVNFGPYGEANRANPTATRFADQKAGLLPDWANKEGVPGIEYVDGKLHAPNASELTGQGLEVIRTPEGDPYLHFNNGNIISPDEAESLSGIKKLLGI